MAKSIKFTVAITPEQKKMWSSCAEALNMTLPEFVRKGMDVYTVAQLKLIEKSLPKT